MGERVSENLDAKIINAHFDGDGLKLAELYFEAAKFKEEAGDQEAFWFLCTQAFVFALESAHPLEREIRCILAADSRELNE